MAALPKEAAVLALLQPFQGGVAPSAAILAVDLPVLLAPCSHHKSNSKEQLSEAIRLLLSLASRSNPEVTRTQPSHSKQAVAGRTLMAILAMANHSWEILPGSPHPVRPWASQ